MKNLVKAGFLVISVPLFFSCNKFNDKRDLEGKWTMTEYVKDDQSEDVTAYGEYLDFKNEKNSFGRKVIIVGNNEDFNLCYYRSKKESYLYISEDEDGQDPMEWRYKAIDKSTLHLDFDNDGSYYVYKK